MSDKTIDDRSYCADAEYIFSKKFFLMTGFSNDILSRSRCLEIEILCIRASYWLCRFDVCRYKFLQVQEFIFPCFPCLWGTAQCRLKYSRT